MKKKYKNKEMIKYLKLLIALVFTEEEEVLLKGAIKTLRTYKKLEKENKKLKEEINKYKNAIRIEGRIIKVREIKLPKGLVLGTPKKKKPRVRLNP